MFKYYHDWWRTVSQECFFTQCDYMLGWLLICSFYNRLIAAMRLMLTQLRNFYSPSSLTPPLSDNRNNKQKASLLPNDFHYYFFCFFCSVVVLVSPC